MELKTCLILIANLFDSTIRIFIKLGGLGGGEQVLADIRRKPSQTMLGSGLLREDFFFSNLIGGEFSIFHRCFVIDDMVFDMKISKIEN